MPPKRKSTEANLENRLPEAPAVNDAKRAKIIQNPPLGDISNSPWPIKWTAFGAGKYVEDPLRPVAPINFTGSGEKIVEENVEDEAEPAETGEDTPEEVPTEAPAKKAAAKKAAAKKATPKGKANATEPAPVEPVAAPEPAATEPQDTTAPAKKGRKPAAKRATPKGASKAVVAAAPTEEVVAIEESVVKATIPVKKSAAKKATPTSKSKLKATDPAPVEAVPALEEPVSKAKKPAAKKATPKAKAAKATEPVPVTEPVEPTKPAKKPTKAKAKATTTEGPVVIAEPEAPAPAPAKKSTKATKAAKEPKEPAPKPAKLPKGTLPEFITTITLEGEEDDSVPVFDTCDVIRRKITGALNSATHTKASLMRAFAACTSEPDHPIAPNSFQRFMSAKGKTGGCANRTFYAAYVYFEKQRIAEKKKKTKTREEMELAWGDSGMNLENLGRAV
ncbi:hypothetical protein TWF718_002879 [Orbilia javanica]|uniref:DUF7726 domain-containing protein n=1 Tax=Orbilia javanica TaxID=47235 RepID=A0AAN8MP12_9PEZI